MLNNDRNRYILNEMPLASTLLKPKVTNGTPYVSLQVHENSSIWEKAILFLLLLDD